MQLDPSVERPPAVFHLPPSIRVSSRQLWDICRANPEWRIELTAQGDLLIMPPTGAKTGARNQELSLQLAAWAKRDGSGISFDSSTGFELPNGAMRSPDAAWVRRDRLANLSDEQKEHFLPLCPDFVAELKSPSDNLKELRDKLAEYMENGARLGWLIDPERRRVYVHRSAGAVEELDDPVTLSGEPVLPGFVLDLLSLWDPGF